MTNALNIFNTVWPYLAAGGGITIATQILKRLAKLENNAVILLLFHTITVLTTALTYVLGAHGIPAFILLLHGAAYSGIANTLYPVVKGVNNFLTKLKQALDLINKEAPVVEQAINDAAANLAAQTPPPANF